MRFPFRSSIVALALLCVSVMPSHAVTENIGLITNIGEFGHTGFTGPFNDRFDFQLAGPTSFNARVSLDSATAGINPFTLEVWAASGIAPILQSSAFTIDGNGVEFLSVAGFLGGAGDYFIRVFGTASVNPSLYNGTLVVSQVPIPGALLLFGSGLVGLCALARKRRRAKVMLTT